MSFLKRINRGAILSFFVIICVAFYLVSIAMTQEQEKPAIQDICKKYLATEVNYYMLPEKYRVEKPEMPESELNAYILKMQDDVKAYFVDNRQLYKYTIDFLKDNINAQVKDKKAILEFKKDVSHFESFVFEGDSVVVTMSVKTEANIPESSSIDTDSIKYQKKVVMTTEKLSLQKVNGEYKLTYADTDKNLISNSNDMKEILNQKGAVRYGYGA